MDPILLVLAWAGGAALAASLGTLPHALRGGLPMWAIGWANALAAGLMLGVAYALLAIGLPENVAIGGIAALLGVGFVRLSHFATGTIDLELNRLEQTRPEYGYQVLLVNTLHAAHEGIAIGAAMLISLPFGISMALALAVHNIPEGTILTAILHGRGVRLHHAAALATAVNVNQVLLAVVTFAVGLAAPALVPWAVGFAAGALIYLVLVELLPESYREAGHTSIAVVAVTAMSLVVLLAGAPS